MIPRMLEPLAGGIEMYLAGSLQRWARTIFQILSDLTFADNFVSLETDVELPAPSGGNPVTVAIPNKLGGKGIIPSRRIILKQDGPGSVYDPKEWTRQSLYLAASGNTATIKITVLFLR